MPDRAKTAAKMADTVERRFAPETFRQALGQYPTGVTIVTAMADGEPVGMTANSFASVSLEPPLVLWSVAKSARSHDAFRAAETFAVHVLGAEHEALARLFASREADKFGATEFSIGASGAPLLTRLAPVFECRTWAIHPGGDHTIILGEVTDLVTRLQDPLVFHSGALRVF